MQIQRTLELIVYIIAAVLVGLFVYLAPSVFVADSEFWSIGLGYHLWEDYKYDWVFTRPLYYFLLWLSQLGYSSPSGSIFWARSLFVVNALVISFFMLKILKKRTGYWLYGGIAILLLFGNTGFMNQGFRVRSDLLATTLSLGSLWAFTHFPNAKIYLALSPLLATPKAILQVVALAPFVVKRKWTKNFFSIFAGLAVLGGILFYFNRGNLSYLTHGLLGGTGGPSYLSKESFYHVGNQLMRNPLFWLLFVLRFFSWEKVRKSATVSLEEVSLEKKFKIFTLLCGLFVLASIEKVQFFIASFLPFFAVQAALFFYDLPKLGFKTLRNIALILSCTVFFLTGGYWFLHSLEKDNNQSQLKSLDSVYTFMQERQIESFQDFTCLIPPLCKTRSFVGPHQPQWNMAALEVMKADPPVVFFYLKKAKLLEPHLQNFLRERYAALGRGVFVLKEEVSQTDTGSEKLLQTRSYFSEKTEGIDKLVSGQLESLFGYDIDY